MADCGERQLLYIGNWEILSDKKSELLAQLYSRIEAGVKKVATLLY
jgi:hypothetical protein